MPRIFKAQTLTHTYRSPIGGQGVMIDSPASTRGLFCNSDPGLISFGKPTGSWSCCRALSSTWWKKVGEFPVPAMDWHRRVLHCYISIPCDGAYVAKFKVLSLRAIVSTIFLSVHDSHTHHFQTWDSFLIGAMTTSGTHRESLCWSLSNTSKAQAQWLEENTEVIGDRGWWSNFLVHSKHAWTGKLTQAGLVSSG